MTMTGDSISWLLNSGVETQSLFDQFLRQCDTEYDYTLTIYPKSTSN